MSQGEWPLMAAMMFFIAATATAASATTPTPTWTATLTPTRTPTATTTPTYTYTATSTPTPAVCCECPNSKSCGPSDAARQCPTGCTAVPNAACHGASGKCATLTPIPSATPTTAVPLAGSDNPFFECAEDTALLTAETDCPLYVGINAGASVLTNNDDTKTFPSLGLGIRGNLLQWSVDRPWDTRKWQADSQRPGYGKQPTFCSLLDSGPLNRVFGNPMERDWPWLCRPYREGDRNDAGLNPGDTYWDWLWRMEAVGDVSFTGSTLQTKTMDDGMNSDGGGSGTNGGGNEDPAEETEKGGKSFQSITGRAGLQLDLLDVYTDSRARNCEFVRRIQEGRIHARVETLMQTDFGNELNKKEIERMVREKYIHHPSPENLPGCAMAAKVCANDVKRSCRSNDECVDAKDCIELAENQKRCTNDVLKRCSQDADCPGDGKCRLPSAMGFIPADRLPTLTVAFLGTMGFVSLQEDTDKVDQDASELFENHFVGGRVYYRGPSRFNGAGLDFGFGVSENLGDNSWDRVKARFYFPARVFTAPRWWAATKLVLGLELDRDFGSEPDELKLFVGSAIGITEAFELLGGVN